MDNKIRAYQAYMGLEIDKLEEVAKNTESKDDKELFAKRIDSLHRYHIETVSNFQHERLIHLIVTFFFASLFLLSVAGLFWALSSFEIYSLMVILTSVMCLILLITELFYIKHYYDLENGVQKLYLLSDRLYRLK